MSHRIFCIGLAGCYVLAYILVVILAARRGSNIADTYSLLVWLVSAAIVTIVSGLAALVVAGAVGRLRIRPATLLIAWSISTVIMGGALVVNAM